MGDKSFNLINYRYLYAKLGLRAPTIDYVNPKRFNHKILWLKMNYRHSNAALYADKVLVKDWVSENIGSDLIIPTLDVWGDAFDISFSELPDSFVLKANHGSGWNILVADKYALDEVRVRKTLNSWLKCNYFDIGREYQYQDIEPQILAEPLLDPGEGKQLLDYKFFCFNGEPHFVQVDIDRYASHSRNFYDLSWHRLPLQILYPTHPDNPDRPANFDRMIEIAKKLSIGFPFIRVDLYDCAGRIYFGELTFHPEGGFGPIQPDEWDEKLGELLKLPA